MNRLPLIVMRSLLCLSLIALVGCSEALAPTEPEPDRDVFELQLGVWNAEDEVFSELQDEGTTELVMGFQGLVFVNLALFAGGSIPARYVADGEIVFEDVDERIPFFDGQVLFEPLGDDHRLVPSFRVPFNLPASELDGRVVRLDITLSSHDGKWESSASTRFTIHDGECEHLPSGEIVCD